MSRITTVIFDMFNTLVEDGETYWMASFQHITQEQGLDIQGAQLRKEWSSGDQDFRGRRTSRDVPFQTYGDAWLKSFQRTFTALGLSGNADGAVDIVMEDMGLRPIHGDTLEALTRLESRCRVALLSNADDRFLEPVVQRLGVNFEVVLSSEAAQCYKPRPELFEQMLQRLKVSPQEAVYVGDRQYEDVNGASGAGMRSIWINRDGVSLDHSLSAPDHHVTSLLEIPGLIERVG